MENVLHSDTSSATTKHIAASVEAPNCPVHSVVVYTDRAEVCRTVKADLQRGENEVTVRRLPPAIDQDSIRVEGSGGAIITEVTYSCRAKEENEEEVAGADARRAELKKQEDELLQREEALKLANERINKQRDVLTGLSNHIANGGGKNMEDSGSFVSALGGETLHGVTRFFELHRIQSERLDSSLRDVESEMKQVESELKAVRANLQQLMPRPEDADFCREVKIVLEAEHGMHVQLQLYYVVTHASWIPRYDLRVFSKDKKIQINYFGVIQQSTGEDWENAKLSLSTAMPSVGGSPPDLPTHTLHIKPPPSPTLLYKRGKKERAVGSAKSKRASERFSTGEEDEAMNSELAGGSFGELEEGLDIEAVSPSTPPPQLAQPTVEVKHSIISTAYEIARRSTIKSDSAAQKVTVALLHLKPSFEYETVPKLAAHAFLKARVKNESEFALLEGPANVFLDNNFVSKTSLKPVSPKEEFDCSLGVDPSVRVTYKPAKKFRQQHGILTNKTVTKVEQHIEIKNTRQDSCRIKVTDQVPLSSDDKIKVTSVEPEFRRGEKSKTLSDGSQVVISKTHILEWMVDIEAGKSHMIKLQYNVEHPSSETISGL